MVIIARGQQRKKNTHCANFVCTCVPPFRQLTFAATTATTTTQYTVFAQVFIFFCNFVRGKYYGHKARAMDRAQEIRGINVDWNEYETETDYLIVKPFWSGTIWVQFAQGFWTNFTHREIETRASSTFMHFILRTLTKTRTISIQSLQIHHTPWAALATFLFLLLFGWLFNESKLAHW